MELITHLDKIVKRKRDPIRETEDRIQERLRKVEPGTDEFTKLLEQQQQCKDIRRSQRDTAGWWQKLIDILRMIVYGGGALGITMLGYALDMESPKALKIADRCTKMLPNQKM